MTPEMQFFAAKCIGCGQCIKVCPSATDRALFSDACTVCGICAENCMAEAMKKVGRYYSVEEIMNDLRRDADVYLSSGGGITCTGGEPLLQTEFLKELLTACKNAGWHTAVETAACVPWDSLSAIADVCDLFICDIKTMDSALHRRCTWQTNELILENIRRLSSCGKPLLLRTPIIPGVNDDDASVAAIAAFTAELPDEVSLELLPFRNLCAGKYESLHREFSAVHLETPSPKRMNELAEIVRSTGVFCTVNGI